MAVISMLLLRLKHWLSKIIGPHKWEVLAFFLTWWKYILEFTLWVFVRTFLSIRDQNICPTQTYKPPNWCENMKSYEVIAWQQQHLSHTKKGSAIHQNSALSCWSRHKFLVSSKLFLHIWFFCITSKRLNCTALGVIYSWLWI